MRAETEAFEIDYVARLNENIEWLRKRAGVSQRRLAGLSDMGVSTLKKWQAGASAPTLDKLDELARTLGLEGAHELLLTLNEIKSLYGDNGEGLRPFVLSRLTSAKSRSRDSGDLNHSEAAATESDTKGVMRTLPTRPPDLRSRPAA